jgi:hypothetical protein
VLIYCNAPVPIRATLVSWNKQGAFSMWDIAMLALGFGFFAAGIGYAYVCERL